MIDNKYVIAIVGCGGMGGGHAIAITSGTGNAIWNTDSASGKCWKGSLNTDISKKLMLSGVYDIDIKRKKWAQDRGLFNYESFEAILEDKIVDIVLIATPNDSHRELAIASMRAGKHVLCEKPVMMSSVELEDVMKVAKETGKIFYPRQNRRWDEDFRIMKKIYDEKLLGDMFNIECRVMGSRGIPGDWRGTKAHGGGMMLDWGVHLIDRLLVMIPEKIKTVFCSLSHITNDEVDDGFKMHITFESGLTAVIEVGTNHFISLPLWYAAGSHGTVQIDSWECNGKIIQVKDRVDEDAAPILAGAGLTKTMAPRLENSVITSALPKVEFDNNELYSNLVDTINGSAEQIVTTEQALRVLKLMEAAFESDRNKSVIFFE